VVDTGAAIEKVGVGVDHARIDAAAGECDDAVHTSPGDIE
jgi:hypothetical protein